MTIVPSNPRRIRSFSPQNAAIPPLEMRDSIRSKEGWVWEGRRNLSAERFLLPTQSSSPRPALFSYSFKRFATHSGRARYNARRGRHQPGV